MNIHGLKQRIKSLKQEIKEIEEELSERGLKKEEKYFLIRRRGGLRRKKRMHMREIKELKRNKTLKKNGKKTKV